MSGRNRLSRSVSGVGVAPMLAGALFATACGGGGPPLPAERANLLLVTVSSLRADHLGIYGYRRNISPRLDLFGASGAVFLDAVTPWPETGRAAAAVLSGQDPARITGGDPARLLDAPGLAASLGELGYRTSAAVSHPALAAALGFSNGFDEFREHWHTGGAEATDAVSGFATEMLSEAAAASPFFLWLHFTAPAPPQQPSDEDLAAVANDGLTPEGPLFRPGSRPVGPATGGPGYGAAVDRYDAAVRSVDRAFGRMLDTLTHGPAAGRTLVAFAGLHGESLGEHGPSFGRPRSLFRETLRVPLLLGWPGADPPRAPTAVRFGSAVGVADLAPTALALLGVPASEPTPAGAIGKSLVPALEGNEPRPHRRLYAQTESGLFGVFDGRLRMLRIPVAGQEPLFALFNLSRDPNEAENLYPERRGSAEPLRAQLETRRIQTVAWRQQNERRAGADLPLPPRLLEALAARGYR